MKMLLNTSDLFWSVLAYKQRSWACGGGSPFQAVLLEHLKALSSSSGDENTLEQSHLVGPQEDKEEMENINVVGPGSNLLMLPL